MATNTPTFKDYKWMIISGLVLVGLWLIYLFAYPMYNVWRAEMSGRAELMRAEQNRKIQIEEAKANLEAEKLNAQAEIERAKGAAEAIKIENVTSLPPIYSTSGYASREPKTTVPWCMYLRRPTSRSSRQTDTSRPHPRDRSNLRASLEGVSHH